MPFPQRERQMTWPRHRFIVTEAARIALECSFVANAGVTAYVLVCVDAVMRKTCWLHIAR